ncbi:hypothetical protein L1987_63145 [Smallanthus sonchifolius]|uniref:Uncharacterized protein n=1 Tax=Smallanthus sonchifolius TaxID=185202 RepID=A0ACB9CCR9_9ASTR|nr:hypothetical protein L1987_63145 [Smallanthus sonchifolius]
MVHDSCLQDFRASIIDSDSLSNFTIPIQINQSMNPYVTEGIILGIKDEMNHGYFAGMAELKERSRKIAIANEVIIQGMEDGKCVAEDHMYRNMNYYV